MRDNKRSMVELAAVILKDVVAPLPAIDIHTHISPHSPSAADLGDILFYHYIVTELRTSGVTRERMAKAISAEEKFALFCAEQGRISNTTTFWCLRQVLDALGLPPHASLSVKALTDLNRNFTEASSHKGWPRQFLVENLRILATFLTLSITEELPEFDDGLFAGTLRLDDLLAGLSPSTMGSIENISRINIGSLDSFERAAGERMNSFATSGGRAVTAGLPPEEEFVPASRPDAAKLFDRVRRGEALNGDDRAGLHSYVLRAFVGLAQDLRLPVQLMLGVRRPLPGDAAVPVVRPDLAARFAPLFHGHPAVRFDLILSSVAHSQELIAVAKNYPNVSLAGCWWYAFTPPYIRTILTERLLALPAAKLHGFFSDAYNIEWSSGKLALLRRELARVLAELIVSGDLSESQAPEIAGALLYENPARFYGIPHDRVAIAAGKRETAARAEG